MKQALPARVVLVAGLHAEARRRAVDRLLEAEPGALAVHHDLGRIGSGEVHRVLRDRWGTVERARVDLVHSCMSCTLRVDLVPLLCGLAERGEHRLYVVESWDGVDPRSVAEALTATLVDDRPVTGWLHLAGVATAVDADRLIADLATTEEVDERGLAVAEEDERTVAEVLARQVEYPTCLVLDGDVPAAERERCSAVLLQLNPAALVVPPEREALSAVAEGGFDAAAAAARQDPGAVQPPDHCEAGEVRTLTWRRSRPLHPERLHRALDDLVPAALRSRGRFWLASHPDTMLAWDAAGAALAVESHGPWLAALPDAAWEMVSEQRRAAAALDWCTEHGDRCQCLTFTGVGLDTRRLTEVLDSCLLTDEELAAGYRREDGTEDPFDAIIATAP
ncbi:CobW family GTP-binding protein [Nocardiopsis halophila]|uniref:CobW family GTP-binding protein n=1 Tax=Nocardiopsis halophila TaxID=141692 RepID=UPI00034CE326|nr:GTP-binding protein [Nocardiopsis halophila]